MSILLKYTFYFIRKEYEKKNLRFINIMLIDFMTVGKILFMR